MWIMVQSIPPGQSSGLKWVLVSVDLIFMIAKSPTSASICLKELQVFRCLIFFYAHEAAWSWLQGVLVNHCRCRLVVT